MNNPVRVARISALVGVVVFLLKWYAYRLTGSTAMYSDALESIINIIAALVALFAVSISLRPADDNHPYGHTKAEYFSAVLEGVFIVLAAFAIVAEALRKLQNPEPVSNLGYGLIVSMVASGINGFLAVFLIRSGRRNRSPALVADGQHIWTDVITSVGVLIGLVLAWATGYLFLDPLLAVAVAVNILWVGWKLVRTSVGGLMDEAVPPAELALIENCLDVTLEGFKRDGEVIEFHDLKSRKAGNKVFIEFHLVVAGELSVRKAHAVCDALELALKKMDDIKATIHVEPVEKAKLHATLK